MKLSRIFIIVSVIFAISFSAVFSVDETHDIEFLKKELKALFVTTPNKDIYIINIVSDNAKQARPIVTIIPKALSGKEIENFTARSSYELYHLLKRLMGDALIEEEFNYFTDLYTEARRILNGRPSVLPSLESTPEPQPKLTNRMIEYQPPQNRITPRPIGADEPGLLSPNRFLDFIKGKTFRKIPMKKMTPSQLRSLEDSLDLAKNIERINKPTSNLKMIKGVLNILDKGVWRPLKFISRTAVIAGDIAVPPLLILEIGDNVNTLSSLDLDMEREKDRQERNRIAEPISFDVEKQYEKVKEKIEKLKDLTGESTPELKILFESLEHQLLISEKYINGEEISQTIIAKEEELKRKDTGFFGPLINIINKGKSLSDTTGKGIFNTIFPVSEDLRVQASPLDERPYDQIMAKALLDQIEEAVDYLTKFY